MSVSTSGLEDNVIRLDIQDLDRPSIPFGYGHVLSAAAAEHVETDSDDQDRALNDVLHKVADVEQ